MRIRAFPARVSRSRRRVFSFDRNRPIRGRVIVARSGSTRIAPVVNRIRLRALCLASNRGNPTRAPLRVPFLESDQFFRAVAASAIPHA